MNIFFLFRNHYSVCDFRFLFGHHNSICEVVWISVEGAENLSLPHWKQYQRLCYLYTIKCILIHTRQYIVDDLKLMYETLRNAFRSLWSEPSPDKRHEVMQLPQFEDIVERVLTFEKRSGGEMIVNYLKNVSFFLLLVSAVRECNIEQHLLTVRNMTIKIMYVIIHIKISTYTLSNK